MQEWEKESERDSKGKKRAQRDPWGQAQAFVTIGSCKTSAASPNRWHNPLWGQHLPQNLCPSTNRPRRCPTTSSYCHAEGIRHDSLGNMLKTHSNLSNIPYSWLFKKLSQLFKFINLLFLRVFDFPQVCVVSWAYHHTRPSHLVPFNTQFYIHLASDTRTWFHRLSII